MRLIQFSGKDGQSKVGIVENDKINILKNISTTYQLFTSVLQDDTQLEKRIQAMASGSYEPYNDLLREKRVMLPLAHPDPYHTWLTGTGLTHLGSAASRNSMHQKLSTTSEQDMTDSMKMFRMGLENGKMLNNVPASQPEWFYKGNGLMAVAPEGTLPSPTFAMDGGEEPELTGIYINDAKGNPRRIGFALGNEFSDHKMEKINYLYLAHSKLRHCSYGPELLLGPLPAHIAGKTRIIRNGKVIWEKEFLTGEGNMSHNFANLEHHHFKYELFRQPGDVHIHYFGTSVISFAENIVTKNGDIFEIEANGFGKPLRNTHAFNA